MKTKGGGSGKGAAFEREICVRLSQWISSGTRRDLFWRSAMSGGRATVAFKRGERLDRQAGDICAIDPLGHALTDRYYFECKFRRNIKFENFTLFGQGPLAAWWREACLQANRYGRSPVLIAKSNRVAPIIITFPNSTMNPLPVARIRGCEVGILARVLATKFTGAPDGTQAGQEQQHRKGWIRPRKSGTAN